MKIIPTKIPDVKIIQPNVYGDERGFFMETWHQKKFAQAGIHANFVQDNHSRSSQGILRGLHYQIKHTQGKLVRVTKGAVFDVVVDLRKSSPTFGQWFGIELSAKNHTMLWVPPKMAHGFYTLSETADFIYKCSDFYAPEYEKCILWNDEELAIDWSLKNNQLPTLSAKDADGLSFKNAEVFE